MGKSINVKTLRVKRYNFINYCYILLNHESRTQVILDPAWEYQTIVNALEEYPYQLSGILLTHSHFDHVNLADSISEYFDAPVFISERESSAVSIKKSRLVELMDDQVLNLGGMRILCLSTPGHSEGSICYLCEDSVFTGDTVLTEGCGICNTEEAARTLYDSFQKFRNHVSEECFLYPGHSFGMSTGESMKEVYRSNIYFHFNNADDFASFRMRPKKKNLFNFN